MILSSFRYSLLSIFLLFSSPAAALSWTITLGLGSSSEIALDAQLVTTPNNDSLVIWDNDTLHEIQTATLASGSTTWATPVTVMNGANCMTPRIAFHASGNAVAVWRNIPLNNVQGATYSALTATWSAPTNLSTTGQSAAPQVEVYSTGDAIAVWKNNGVDRIQTSTYSSLTSSWSAPLNISTNTAVRTPQLEIDGSDNTVVAWNFTRPPIQAIQAITLLAGSSWSTPVDISTPPLQQVVVPRLALYDNGNGIALWTNRVTNTVQVTMYDGNTQSWWASPINISAIGEVASNSAQLAVNNSDGRAIAIWTNTFIKAIQVSIYSPISMTWSCPTIISWVNANVGLPQVAFDSNGNILAVWENKDTVTIEAATLLNGDTSWNLESAIIPISGPLAINPQIVFNAYGEAVVLWEENIAGIRNMYAAVSSNIFVP